MRDAPFARVVCPGCGRVHAAPLPPPPGRGHLACTRCEHAWAFPDPLRDERTAPTSCARHSARAATTVCGECGNGLCAPCTDSAPRPGRAPARASACCGGTLVPIARTEVVRPTWSELPAVLAWPLREAGLFVLGVFWIGQFVPFVSWLLGIVMAAYLQHVLRTSARGARHLPPFPDFGEPVQGIVAPLARFVGVIGVLWGPVVLYRHQTDAAFDDPVAWVLRLLPLLLGPFGITIASVASGTRALLDLPHLTRVLARILPRYVAALAVIAPLVLVWIGLRRSAPGNGVVAWAETLFRTYALFVAFHVLGRMVRETRHRVEWEV